MSVNGTAILEQDQYGNGLVCIASLQCLEACLVDEFHRKHPQKRVVIDD
jgi:hypothetical protein